MSDLPLGKTIDAAQQRDAIHIAVAPVIAGEALQPGQHVGFVDGSTETVVSIADGPRGLQNKPAIGIVDPFLTVKVNRGDRIWLFLYPGTITSLRHDWTHPAFVRTQAVVESDPIVSARSRIQAIADDLDITYNQLMQAAELWLSDEEYTVQFGSENWRNDFPRVANEFWRNYEIVTGTQVKDRDVAFFSCSC